MKLPGLFPGGRRAAVSLTYDDGVEQQLDVAMPELEAAGLRGTFYVHTRQPEGSAWNRRAADWRAAAERGHEIGNHTQFHPCGDKPDLPPHRRLEAYNLGRMETELLAASKDLDDAVGVRPARSYAYTCWNDWVGPTRESYRPMAARLFPACRGGGNRSADPFDCDFAWVPSWNVRDDRFSARQALELIDASVDAGQWLVLMFHGVGGGHGLNFSREPHAEVCRHVARRADTLWCDTFLNVAMHLRRATNRPWTPTEC